jgi:hypothetical protein
VYSSAGSVPPLFHLFFCTPTKFTFYSYLHSSLKTVIRKPALYKLLTFHNPNLMSVFNRLSCSCRESVEVRGSLMTFVTNLIFYGKGLLAPRPISKLEDHPLSFVRGCLFNISAATLHSWRPFLHAPCCGDKELTNIPQWNSHETPIFERRDD